jgi:FkbM family methyltransferase
VELARAYGIGRSLAMYYGQVWKRRRMQAFYAQFLGAGELAFDVGAHVGNRVGAWRRLGAKVVAVEPQPDMLTVLRALYGRDPGVALVPSAVGAAPGEGMLWICTRSPTISSCTRAWIEHVQNTAPFRGVTWDTALPVELITLDALIARHGEPAFCKIDVEGGELDVLRGLATPLRALSFEYIPAAIDTALACIGELARLGVYEFRHSNIESMRWAGPAWLTPQAMLDTLRRLPASGRSGDVYARRRDARRPRAAFG